MLLSFLRWSSYKVQKNSSWELEAWRVMRTAPFMLAHRPNHWAKCPGPPQAPNRLPQTTRRSMGSTKRAAVYAPVVTATGTTRSTRTTSITRSKMPRSSRPLRRASPLPDPAKLYSLQLLHRCNLSTNANRNLTNKVWRHHVLNKCLLQQIVKLDTKSSTMMATNKSNKWTLNHLIRIHQK